MNQATRITTTKVNEITSSWATCLIGELSNLFYYIHHKNKNKNKNENENERVSLKRYNNHFSLGQDGINQLLNLGSEPARIRIYMGCSKGGSDEAKSTFSPLLCIVSGQGTDYYPLAYSEKNNFYNLVQISPQIADLFHSKWRELSDTEVADAFSGVTKQKIESNETQENLRVRFYEFPKDDVAQMIKHLKGTHEASRYVRLLLGAGLTVRLTHPFNFRPILVVPSSRDVKEPNAYYERSKPCPPYCND